ncbi:MAG: hypothetical protein HKN42_11130 [Granulosicoccus sp.]|nr:hypothetical protein [Granulosicoccus sp.]
MSFSRLNPRSKHRGVVSTHSSSRPGRQSTRRLRLWDAIRRTREQIEQWQTRATETEQLFREHIQPREEQLTLVHGQLTETLLDHYSAATLPIAEQALLGLWIADQLQSLLVHPFASKVQVDALAAQWRELQGAQPGPVDGPDNCRGDRMSSTLDEALEEDEPDDDDIVFDFGWHTDRRPADSASNAGATQQESAHRTRSRQERPDPPENMNELDNKLSVDQLFRQLARVLHPDREQDEALKARKHTQMSLLLKARHERDIHTLMTLYEEHIGDLPELLSIPDHEELLNALDSQLRQLLGQLREVRSGNPLQRQIIERYCIGDDRPCLNLIRQHAQALDTEIDALRSQCLRLNSREAVIDALARRRELEQDRRVIDQMTGY